MATQPYKILSLDGGGSWALIQAYALGDMFGMDTPGHSILRHYDLVAANSGGSIVLGCLCCNMTPREITSFFLDEAKRKQIFVRRGIFNWSSLTQNLEWLKVGYKYVTGKKLEGLRTQFNLVSAGLADKTIPEVATFINAFQSGSSTSYTHIIFVGFDYDIARAKYFRSNTHSLSSPTHSTPEKATLAEAIHASSNAPLNYFDAPAKAAGRQYWDGAITGHNNPVAVAVIEALANKQLPGNIVALSIGTGSEVLPHPRLAAIGAPEETELFLKLKSYSFINDILKISTSILADPPEMASFIAHTAAGGSTTSLPAGPIIRMSPLVQPIRNAAAQFDYPVFANYGTSAISPLGRNRNLFNELKELDMDAVKQDEVNLIKILCDSWIGTNPADTSRCCVYNQPVQAKADLSVNIGHRYYMQAKAAALSLGLFK